MRQKGNGLLPLVVTLSGNRPQALPHLLSVPKSMDHRGANKYLAFPTAQVQELVFSHHIPSVCSIHEMVKVMASSRRSTILPVQRRWRLSWWLHSTLPAHLPTRSSLEGHAGGHTFQTLPISRQQYETLSTLQAFS